MFAFKSDNITVRVKTSKKFLPNFSDMYRSVEIHIHPDYVRARKENKWFEFIYDIALIKLNKAIKISTNPITFGDENNICLPQNTPLKDGMKEYAMTSGWGGNPLVYRFLQIGYLRVTYEPNFLKSMNRGYLPDYLLKSTVFHRRLDNLKFCMVRSLRSYSTLLLRID